MRKPPEERTDIYAAKEKILAICKEYNVSIEWEDYTSCWLYDKDTEETTGFDRT